MADLWIINARIVNPGHSSSTGSVLLRGGRIAQVDSSIAPKITPGASVIDAQTRLLTPGLIDLHTHGIGMHFYERDPQDILQAAELLPRFGTTCVLPTLYRVMNRPSLSFLERLADALPRARGAAMPGFHLEGPFLSLPGAGADTIPGDVKLLQDLLAACRGRVLAMSISPDTPNILPVIEYLSEKRIASLITHTRASVEQTEAAIAAGARHATHFYNVFPVPPETEPGCRPCGAVEAILADPRVSVDFICDGVHVPSVAIRAALAAKGAGGVVLITDSTFGAGLPPGEFETTWGFRVKVAPGDAARISTPGHPGYGLLAGSTLTMDQSMRNLSRLLSLPPHESWALGTINPARVVGLENKGAIRVGADADLVLWDDQLQVLMTWIGGNLCYEAAAGVAR